MCWSLPCRWAATVESPKVRPGGYQSGRLAILSLLMPPGSVWFAFPSLHGRRRMPALGCLCLTMRQRELADGTLHFPQAQCQSLSLPSPRHCRACLVLASTVPFSEVINEPPDVPRTIRRGPGRGYEAGFLHWGAHHAGGPGEPTGELSNLGRCRGACTQLVQAVSRLLRRGATRHSQ